jgi:putative oxidoreductase
MKKFLSVSFPTWAFNLAMLVLRLAAGGLIIPYGYDKLVHFAEKKNTFMNLFGAGSALTLAVVIFAEFFCGMFVVLGLFTRLTVIPLVISMSVAVFKVNHADFFGKGTIAALFLAGFVVILLCGPGKASADGLINK